MHYFLVYYIFIFLLWHNFSFAHKEKAVYMEVSRLFFIQFETIYLKVVLEKIAYG